MFLILQIRKEIQDIKFCLFACFWPCLVAYKNLVSWPGIEPGPMAVKALSLTTEPPGNFQDIKYIINVACQVNIRALIQSYSI